VPAIAEWAGVPTMHKHTRPFAPRHEREAERRMALIDFMNFYDYRRDHGAYHFGTTQTTLVDDIIG
jgi:hypothetical protein